jgi:hypothetical protein
MRSCSFDIYAYRARHVPTSSHMTYPDGSQAAVYRLEEAYCDVQAAFPSTNCMVVVSPGYFVLDEARVGGITYG